MDGVHQSAVDQILSAIEQGNLGVDETERRLQKLIQAEQAKPTAERDQRLIDSAEQLREELHHRTALSFEAKRQKNLDSTVQKYKAWRKQQHKQKQALRISAFAATLLLCLGLGSGLLHWNWFETKPSEDGEQYVIQGHEIRLDTITQAIAAHDEADEITTMDIEDLFTFLGFKPVIPEVIQSSWIACKYYAYVAPYEIQVQVSYQNSESQQKIFYNMSFSTDQSNMFLTIEKENNSGSYINIGSKEVYICKNYDAWNIIWVDGIASHWIYGKVSQTELLEIANSILED